MLAAGGLPILQGLLPQQNQQQGGRRPQQGVMLPGHEGGASPSVGWPCMAAQLWRLWDSEVEPCRCQLRRRQLLHRPLAQQCGEGLAGTFRRSRNKQRRLWSRTGWHRDLA